MPAANKHSKLISGEGAYFFSEIAAKFFLLVLLAADSRAEVSFRAEVAPILAEKCLVCHSREKAKGGYRLENFSELLKPGNSKETPIVPGASQQSWLFKLITTGDEDDRMPQKSDRLKDAEIAVIRRWIEEGAKFDGLSPEQSLPAMTPFVPGPEPLAHYPFPQPILALAWSPDGKTLAASGYHEATLWNLDGKLAGRISRLPQRVHGLAFLNDGSLAIAAGTPGKAGELLLARENETPRVMARIGEVFTTLALNSERTLLAAGGADNSIRIFETSTGKERLNIQQHAEWVTALVFSPDGKRIASASRDRTARVFELENGNLLETYVEHTQPVFAVAFAEDGKRVISGGRGKTPHLWQVEEAKKLGDFPALEGDILALRAVGKRLFMAGADASIREFDIESRKLTRELKGHSDWVYALAYEAGSKRMASGSYNGEIRIWDLEKGELLKSFTAAP